MIYPTICHCVVLYWVYLIAYQAVGVGKEQILEQKTKKRRRRRNTKPRKLLAGARRPKVQLLDIHSRLGVCKSRALARQAVQSHSVSSKRATATQKNISSYGIQAWPRNTFPQG